jgi:MoxR-like ATPase
MKQGGVLLLDEIDLASNKIMCMQPILEGKGILLKKINQYVQPAPGFQIIATANTKGKGSEDGRFIGTNILNEAFLERFPITVEQEYPSLSVEKKILSKELEFAGKADDDFADKLTKWADVIRKTFVDGGIDEIISTRRLVHIVKAYGIFQNRMKAIELCVNRFDDETKSAFVDLYTKVDAESTITDFDEVGESVVTVEETVDKTPF